VRGALNCSQDRTGRREQPEKISLEKEQLGEKKGEGSKQKETKISLPGRHMHSSSKLGTFRD
jgi:hypothetical protein